MNKEQPTLKGTTNDDLHHQNQQPEIIIERDYEDTFKLRVECAIAMNNQKNVPMVDTIVINSGPYRGYCMRYNRYGNHKCELDFYSSNRMFGFEHTIEDIAMAISHNKQFRVEQQQVDHKGLPVIDEFDNEEYLNEKSI